jgi:hypothetical protein
MRRPFALLVLVLAALLCPAAPASANDAQRAAALAQALRTKRVKNVKFEGAKLDEVVKWLRVATGFNYVVKRDVIVKAGIDLDAITVKLELSDVSVATLIELVLDPHGLVAKVEGNVVLFTTKAEALGKPVAVLHPISHITWQKVDFHGRKLDLHPSGYVEEDEPREVPVENDPLTDPAYVVELVKTLVDAPWETEGWSIAATKAVLTCKAPKSVQVRVARALAVIASMK